MYTLATFHVLLLLLLIHYCYMQAPILYKTHPQAEAAAQRTTMMELYTASATSKLKKAGVLLIDMVAVPRGRLYDATVWRLSMAAKKSNAGKPQGLCTLSYHKYDVLAS